ncbi:MAG: hypothetical protein IPP15_12805 [Saprospiraceae bacterium]|uniref:Fibronectin type-III domain-containing protein n=1 Tax=Candidatus Opimibacter skivensis TaxID=2982028 RepID=A0A9D7XPK2_9BACT|nr:hypothetical protein [Candidatus Opimibacter skivensis]
MKHRITFLSSLTLMIIFTGYSSLNAQIVLPHPIISKIINDNLMLRWEPASMEEWERAFKLGYTIEIQGENGEKLSTQNVIPLDAKQFQAEANQAPADLLSFYDACIGLIYPDHSGSGKDLQSITEQMVKTSAHTVDSFRLSMLSFYSSYDMRLGNAVGLGVVIKNVNRNAKHCVISVPGFPSRTHEINTEKQSIWTPTLIAKWGDHKVRLEWDVLDKYKDYMGYYIERSNDGERFFKINALPLLDPAVGIDGNKEGSNIGTEDSLSINYKEFYYRLKPMDYFGNISEASAVAKGYGYNVIQSSPQITFADQENNNTAHLKWVIDERDIKLIKDFNLLRSDKLDGKYVSIDTLAKDIREIHSPMVFETNYYRIEIDPIDGEPVSSFPVFVMGMDTTPPVTPVVIGAFIDTLGRVSISWHPNHEPDLWGYKIFRSNFDTDEYSLQNGKPTLDSTFIDSVSLHLGLKNVYYVLQAVDKRNNRSPFTKPIVLERPDIIPPGTPVILHLSQVHDTIEVYWGKSGSSDVVKHQLFRRNLDSKEGWALVAEFDSLYKDSIYLDPGLAYGNRYAYTMRAIDHVNLISGMAPMQVLQMKAPKVVFDPHIVIGAEYDAEKKAIEVTWSSNQEDKISSILMYRGWEKNKLGKYKYVEPVESSFTEPLSGPITVYYMVKVNYKDDTKSYFSDVVEYVVEK